MPQQPWTKWRKPWKQSYCERRYVEGDRIGLRALAKASGVSQSSLERWCTADGWVEKRGQFQGDLRAKTREKTLEARSDAIAQRQVEILQAHSDANAIYRKLAKNVAAIVHNLASVHRNDLSLSPAQREMKTLKFLSDEARSISLWMGVLERAIAGERVANFLEGVDPKVLEGNFDDISTEELAHLLGDSSGSS